MTLTLPTINELLTVALRSSAEHGSNDARRDAINALLTLRQETIALRYHTDARVACQPKPLIPQHFQLALHFSHSDSAP